MDLIFASHNENKVEEVRDILSASIQLLSLNDAGFHDDIEETGSTLEANALIKAETIYKMTGKNIFSDDTGLFVNALNGDPGVHSSRYAGTGDSKDNIKKLLAELKGKSDRSAYFKTVFCLIINDETHYFEGRVDGEIIEEERGEKGFGYDPVFVPDGHNLTFAEMPIEEKNKISHRFRAAEKLAEFFGRD